jgi:hypothetical protein
MLTALFAACLLTQQQQPRPQVQPYQQLKPQARPRQLKSDTVTVQGRDFEIPHVPTTEKQAKKEYKAVMKKINSTMDILEDDLALLYSKYQGKDILSDFAVSKEKAALPEAVFFASMLRDEKLGAYFDEIVGQWNEWQRATVQAGAGKIAPSKESQQNAAPQADAQPSRIPGVEYKPQNFGRGGVPVGLLPVLRAILADWDIKLIATKNSEASWDVSYKLYLPTVASLQSVLGLSRADAQKLRNQKALRIKMMFLITEDPTMRAAIEIETETNPLAGYDWGDELELSPELEAIRQRLLVQQNFGNAQIASVISTLYAPDFAKAWESFQKYLNGRIKEFTEMEANPRVYLDSEIKLMYDMASIKFMEQLRLSLWLCQNVWHRMAVKWKESDLPNPLSKLAPHTVQATTAGNPDSHIVLSEMSKKDLIDLAKVISRKDPRLFMVRMAQPIYVPNEGETSQAEGATVKVTIAMSGSVSGAEYVSGPEHLRELSLQAAKLLKFYPLRESGFNEPQSTNISFSFD